MSAASDTCVKYVQQDPPHTTPPLYVNIYKHMQPLATIEESRIQLRMCLMAYVSSSADICHVSSSADICHVSSSAEDMSHGLKNSRTCSPPFLRLYSFAYYSHKKMYYLAAMGDMGTSQRSQHTMRRHELMYTHIHIHIIYAHIHIYTTSPPSRIWLLGTGPHTVSLHQLPYTHIHITYMTIHTYTHTHIRIYTLILPGHHRKYGYWTRARGQ